MHCIQFIWNYDLSGVDLRIANCSRNLQLHSTSVTENSLILYLLISLPWKQPQLKASSKCKYIVRPGRSIQINQLQGEEQPRDLYTHCGMVWIVTYMRKSRDSIDGTATRNELDDSAIGSRLWRYFPHRADRLWRVQQPERGVDHPS